MNEAMNTNLPAISQDGRLLIQRPDGKCYYPSLRMMERYHTTRAEVLAGKKLVNAARSNGISAGYFGVIAKKLGHTLPHGASKRRTRRVMTAVQTKPVTLPQASDAQALGELVLASGLRTDQKFQILKVLLQA